jgi:hypothetical protein
MGEYGAQPPGLTVRAVGVAHNSPRSSPPRPRARMTPRREYHRFRG